MPRWRHSFRPLAGTKVPRVGEVPARGLGQLEDLLAEVLHLLSAVGDVECNEVGQGSDRRVAELP